MSRFYSFLIFGVILVLLVAEFFIFIKNHELNLAAIIKEAFQNLIKHSSVSEDKPAEVVLIKKEEDLEAEDAEIKVSTADDFGGGLISESELILDEITEKLDEVSEKIDIISAETDSLIKESRKKELLEDGEVEKVDRKGEVEKVEQKKEKEKIEEAEKEAVKIEGNAVVYCRKGEGNPARNKIIFNEISWMGVSSDWRNEWIELKNISNNDISIKNWQILDKDQEIKIIFGEKDKILAGNFFLLERTNDDSVPNITADKIYSGNLNDENEILYLFDENCELEDEVLASPDWPAGDKTEKRTMEIANNLGWQTSLNIGGTPKAENSNGYIAVSGSGGSSPALSYSKILISEIMILPIEQRFIELFNPNNYDVNLTGWYIQRKTKTGTSWSSLVSSIQFDGKIIPASSYFLISRSLIENYDIFLEDLILTEGNAILLKNPNREIVDKVGWGEASDFETIPARNHSLGESLGRKWFEEKQKYQDTDNNQEDFEIQSPTPKAKNQSKINLPLVLEDNVPPEVSFDPFSSLQTDLNFSVSWVGQDSIIEGVTPGGIDGFYLNYDIIPIDAEVTPSDIDGIAFQYQDINNEWQGWRIGQILEFEGDQNLINLLAEDNKIYKLYIKARDRAGNESDWIEALVEVNTLPVVINEIAWMGTSESSFNEWIELFNNTSQSINLTSWVLKAADGTPKISMIGTILAKDYFILERTGDDTLPEIAADQIYSGALGNDGEDFKFFDNSGKLIDSVATCENGWCAGDNNKRTMERINSSSPGFDSNNWKTSQEVGGTPKAQNSQ